MIVQRSDRIYYCCDACPRVMDGQRLGTEHEAMKAMRQAAVLEGWQVKDVGERPTVHLCPECSAEPLTAVVVHIPGRLVLALDLAGTRYEHPVSRGYLVRMAAHKGAAELGTGYTTEQET